MNRRSFLQASTSALVACSLPPRAQTRSTPLRPRPSASQLAWQRDELALFLHFGVNTFTDREWGDGTRILDLQSRRRSTRDSGRAPRAPRGCRAMILTAKHHDGFCLWPTRTTDHSVATVRGAAGTATSSASSSTPVARRGCKSASICRRGIATHPTYGDSPRYNDLYCDQLTELLDALRPDRRGVVRRRQRRRTERQAPDLRLAARLGTRAAAPTERRHVLRRRSRRPLVRQRDAASRAIRTGRR